MEKLTALKAAKYMPCKIKVGEEIKKLVAVSWGENIVDYGDYPDENCESIIQWVDIDSVQLMLHPLSAISDKDAIEVAKLGGQDRSDDTYKITQGKSLVNDYWKNVSNVTANVWVDIINFLRSKSYDCDNYLQTGEAIQD